MNKIVFIIIVNIAGFLIGYITAGNHDPIKVGLLKALLYDCVLIPILLLGYRGITVFIVFALLYIFKKYTDK